MLLLLLLVSPCLGAASQEAILITGGSVSGAEDFQTFRSSELLLSPCSVPSLPRNNWDHVTITMADGIILSCGGSSDSCFQLSPDLTGWTEHSAINMGSMVSNVISAVIPSGAYLMGRNAGAFLPTGSSTWNSFPIPQDHDTRAACAVAISSTSFLLIGGSWEQGDFVDEYESLTGEWTRWQESMPQKRENMQCVRVGGLVLLTGGYNRATNDYDGATVILDTETREWRQGGDMTWEREGHSMSVLASGRVFAYGGGYYGDDGAEEWNRDTETWSPVPDKMEVARSNFGSSVVNIIC